MIDLRSLDRIEIPDRWPEIIERDRTSGNREPPVLDRCYPVRTVAVIVVVVLTLFGAAILARSLPRPTESSVATRTEERIPPDGVFSSTKLPTLDGDVVAISELGSGDAYILVFTGSWVGPSPNEGGSLEEAYQQASDMFGVSVHFVAVTDRTPARLEERIRRAGFKTPILLLDDEAVASQLGLFGYPATFFVNGDGTVAEAFNGVLGSGDITERIEEHFIPNIELDG